MVYYNAELNILEVFDRVEIETFKVKLWASVWHYIGEL